MPGTQRETLFRFLSQPTDVNWGGKVHGGMVMKWMDQAAYACAVGWSGKYAVTASVGGMSFLEPIRIGDLVEVRARVVLTGTTSMHILVEVDSVDPRTMQRADTTRCVMVFVALDDKGQPTAVPKFTPESEPDRRLAAQAQRLKELRAVVDAEFSALNADEAPR